MEPLPVAPRTDHGRRTRLLVCLALLLAPLAVYWSSLSNGLVYDDLVLVRGNPRNASFAALSEQFSGSMWDFLEPDEQSRVGYWRPLAGVALTCANVWGGGAERAFHVASLLLHLAATAAAFALAWRMTRQLAVAAPAALLFALHPVQVESVAWASAINGPLFGLFALLTLERFLAWRERGSRGVPWTAALCFLAALLSKELALAVLPCVIAVDFLRRGAEGPAAQRLQPTGRAYGALLAAVALYLGARMWVFGPNLGFDLVTTDFDVSRTRLTMLRVELAGGMLGLLAWPAELNLFRPIVPDPQLALGSFLQAAGAVAALVGLLVLTRVLRWRVALSACLIVGCALLPVVVGVQSLGTFPLSERLLYFAVFGFALALAWILVRILPTGLAVAALLVLAGVHGWRSHARTAVWKDETALFDEAVRASPDTPYVHWGRGRVMLQRYRNRALDPNPGDVDRLGEAFRSFQQALELADRGQKGDGRIAAFPIDFVQANLGLGWCYLYEAQIDPYHDYETPMRIFESVVQRYPTYEEAHASLGVARATLGRLAEAGEALLAALEINPRYASAWKGLGVVHLRRGKLLDAAAAFERALELRTDDLELLVLLAQTRAGLGASATAEALLARAVAAHPRAAAPLVQQATLRAERGDFQAALELVRRALELAPNDGEAHLLRGKLHARVDERLLAKSEFLRAAELLPTSFEAHYNAASVLLLEPEYPLQQALPFLVRAYSLRPAGPTGESLRATLHAAGIQDVGTLWELASTDAARGDDAAALEWVAAALAVDALHGPSHYLKGFLLRRKQDRAGAEAAWREAVRLLPASLQARLSLGELLEELDRGAEALPVLEQALEIARQGQGREREARAALEQLEERVRALRLRLGLGG